MLALDIDGTLIAPGHAITSRVRAAVWRAHESGCRVVLATGRASFEVVELVQDMELPAGLAVCSNGAVTATVPDGNIVSQRTFVARPVLDALLRHAPEAAIAAEIPGTGYLVTALFPPHKLRGRQTLSTLQSMLDAPVVRVAVRDPAATPEDFHALARKLQIRGASYSVGFEAWLDLGPLGVSKESGLSAAAASLGITADQVLAIGDGYNDLEMLTWAGCGVAMGHAPEALRTIADHTTLTVADDGAAVEIERWFPADAPDRPTSASLRPGIIGDPA